MEGIENVRAVQQPTSVDRWLAEDDDKFKDDLRPTGAHPLDSAPMLKRHSKLWNWYTQEREKQSANRYQMAIDNDFYDNLQWSEEDVEELNDRLQSALVYNEVAPTIDWIIGTEKRTRVDFKVFPRTEDDVQPADAKTKVLKWNSDINKTAFSRSLAFADAVKVGIGWLEDGARSDPTQEPIFSRHENWRNMLHDSSGVERSGKDWRYLFRIKWIDLDIAIAMFPTRRRQLESAAVAANLWGNEEDEDFWYMGQHYQARDQMGQVISRRTFISDSAMVFNRRARVKLIEGWYREPERCHVCHGDIFHGQRFDRTNPTMMRALQDEVISVTEQVQLRVRCAIMTEKDMLQDCASPYKHDRFPFTPIWCYRRGRDGAAYGAIRRIRDPQEDLNKRASKSLFLLSVNRVIADADSVEDHDEAREEAARPDAYIIKKRGTDFKIENNTQLAQEHLTLMDRDGQMIRQAGGVTDENLGRETNAVSGKAIQARQLQGSVVTAEIFDNLRFATQNQGEIQLSLVEQFISEPKVIRLTQARGELKWLKINQPEQDAQGNVRYVNDITASQADFVVDEQDFSQSVRQAMFETMVDLVGKISAVNPEAGLRILKMTLEFSDLPNKDEMASEIAKILGIDDTTDDKDLTPEQLAERQAKQQQQQKQEAVQERAVMLKIEDAQAKIEKTLADAEASRAKASKAMAETIAIQQTVQQQVESLVTEFQSLQKAVLSVVKTNQ